MAILFEELKNLQKRVRELEEEYQEKEDKLKERQEMIRQNDIFSDLEVFYAAKGNLESELGFHSASYDTYDRARSFYEVFSFVWKYLSDSNNIIEPNDVNIHAFGEYLFDDVNKLFTPEELDKVRCGSYFLNDDLENINHDFYQYTWVHPVYKIAAICLRLESLGFTETYDLECRQASKLAEIEELKKQIRDYKIMVGMTIAKGSIAKTEQTVNTMVLPTINNVVKPGINKGIKLLIKKLALDDDQNNEE